MTTIKIPNGYSATAWRNIVPNSGYFFAPDTMRFFRSRIAWGTLTDTSGGYLFVTSEQPPHGARAYTLRKWANGQVDTLGEFQAYETLGKAKTALKREASK